ncbi:MAG: hypothetical protein JXA33_23910 [Anaerolineae bacterium]|nr:hypothetical protein [Anaerolineae bacterium]
MAKENEHSTIKRVSWLIWGGLTLLVILLSSAFSAAWRMNRTLREKLATLEPRLEEALIQQATLQARLEWVESDAYVEAWAREEARMTLPGETLVIPILPTPTPTLPPTPTLTPTPTPTPAPFWQFWWDKLQGD